jgi:hypothetical protein
MAMGERRRAGACPSLPSRAAEPCLS